MLFVVDKPRLQRMLAIVRDDRTPESQSGEGPFLRLEASGNCLRLLGRSVEAEFPATVYEPGVLFLRVTTLRRLLAGMTMKEIGARHLTIQVSHDGLVFGNTRLGFGVGDMLLYPDPATAPMEHPQARMPDDIERKSADPQGRLFDME